MRMRDHKGTMWREPHPDLLLEVGQDRPAAVGTLQASRDGSTLEPGGY